jgi:hypothetical protein
MEITSSPYFCQVASTNLEWLMWHEAFESCLLEGVGGDGLIKLSIAHVSAINWLEWNQIRQTWGQISCMFLLFTAGVLAVF